MRQIQFLLEKSQKNYWLFEAVDADLNSFRLKWSQLTTIFIQEAPVMVNVQNEFIEVAT